MRRLLLHQDNTAAHRAQVTKQFLEENEIEEVEHPLYSPDIAPYDFFVFSTVKRTLRGKRFGSAEAAVEAFIESIDSIPSSD